MIPIHVDFETYSEAPIKKVGAYAYSKHPSTEVLMMAYAVEDETPKLWLPGEDLPEWVNKIYDYKLKIISNYPYRIHAWYDFFELCIMQNVLKWPILNPKHWCDVAASAATMGLPRDLAECGKALNLPEWYRKDPRGDELIKIFSVPQKKNKKVTRIRPKDEPKKFREFCEYCLQDVVSERYIFKVLKPLKPINRNIWEIDRKINLRGVRFDIPNVKNAIQIRDNAFEKLNNKVKKLTDNKLLNIKSPSQLVSYLRRMGIKCENAQKEYLKRLAKETKNKLAKKLIETRIAVARSTLAKYDKILEITAGGNRAFGLLRWHGASTGRWSGSLFQPQNMMRPTLAKYQSTEQCADLFKYKDHELIEMIYGDTMEAVSSSIRTMVTASPGNRLIVSDFSQIESRGLKWLAGDQAGLNIYREGKDIYKFNASTTFKVPYDAVTKDQRLIGKVIELACGYQGAVGAFQSFADVYGVVIPDEKALHFVKAWRRGNQKIVNYWYNLQDAVIAALENPGTVQKIRSIKFSVRGSGRTRFLYCLLPSGRLLAYHRPHLKHYASGKKQILYYGVDSKTRKYAKQQLYGGKIAQNITEGICYDRLAYSLDALEKAGYPAILTVHDEIICDTPKNHGSLDEFNGIMCKNPGWAEGLPVEADGYESLRYKKG